MKIKIISVLIAAGFSCMPMSLVALAQADPPYKNFTEAHKEGVYHIKKGDPGSANPSLARPGGHLLSAGQVRRWGSGG
ncbi:Uncharacterised protein [Mycobacteroides abscessus subsp. massiliense]|nr:Uncharacterised protein [Mycobacteroides abscessus subsp. massiliense]